MFINDDEKLYLPFKAIFEYTDRHCHGSDCSMCIMILMKCVCKGWYRLVHALMKDEEVMLNADRNGIFDSIVYELYQSNIVLPVQCFIFQFPVEGVSFIDDIDYRGKPTFTIMEYLAGVHEDFLDDDDDDWTLDEYILHIRIRLDSTGEEFTTIFDAMEKSRKIEKQNGIDPLNKEVISRPFGGSTRDDSSFGGLHSHVLLVTPSHIEGIPYYHAGTLASLVQHSASAFKEREWIDNDDHLFLKDEFSPPVFVHNVFEGEPQPETRRGVLFDGNHKPCVAVYEYEL